MTMVHFLKDNILNFTYLNRHNDKISFNGNICRVLSTIKVDNNTSITNALERCSGRNRQKIITLRNIFTHISGV